jgi:dTDP-3-amino-3,4,6-trideoxy-alpha-D-glucose transaminase
MTARTIVIPQTDLKSGLSETEPLWRQNLERVLQRAQFVLGEEVAAFEEEFARATNARFAIGVGSGTDAIELCLRERLITSRDQEVITSPLTAPFTGLAVLSAGAKLRFADIDLDSLLLDPSSVAHRITSRTAAILPVHLYGQPCPLQEFRQFGKPVIQDACQAHGAKCEGHPFTDYSDWVAYSFYPTKNLGCLGDGGAITTNDQSIAQQIRMLRLSRHPANEAFPGISESPVRHPCRAARRPPTVPAQTGDLNWSSLRDSPASAARIRRVWS